MQLASLRRRPHHTRTSAPFAEFLRGFLVRDDLFDDVFSGVDMLDRLCSVVAEDPLAVVPACGAPNGCP